WWLLHGRHADVAKRALTAGIVVGALSSTAMFLSGHSNARMVAEHQPAKLAAFEGHFRSEEGGTALYLVGYPDEEREEVVGGVAIPGLLSWLVHGDADRPVRALDTFPREDRPPIVIPFVSYHIMIGLGSYFLVITLWALWLRW